MLVLPPLESVTRAQVTKAALVVALTPVVLSLFRTLRRKMRISKGLDPLSGPKGSFLLGMMPEIVKNISRVYDYQEGLMVQYGGRIKLPPSIFKDGTVM
ncbi:Cytochrome p450 86a2, partial [Globisporangium polare]